MCDMNLAFMGDIHGNHKALEAVLNSARRYGVDRLILTGDIVGYYPFVSEVLDLLDDWDWMSVRGNHEVMLENSMNDELFRDEVSAKYGGALASTISGLEEHRLNQLINFPDHLELSLGGKDIIVCHGSPISVDEYIYPDCDLGSLRWMQEIKADIIICGHTHYPMVRMGQGKTIINPGSVGQSRNGIKKAHWLLYDAVQKRFDLKTQDYDREAVIEAVKRMYPGVGYLSRVLED